VVVWRGGDRLRVRKSISGITRPEALTIERQERGRLEQYVRQMGKVPLFSEFAGKFIETYAITNDKPSEVAALGRQGRALRLAEDAVRQLRRLDCDHAPVLAQLRSAVEHLEGG
jgi:hypothetical protein